MTRSELDREIDEGAEQFFSRLRAIKDEILQQHPDLLVHIERHKTEAFPIRVHLSVLTSADSDELCIAITGHINKQCLLLSSDVSLGSGEILKAGPAAKVDTTISQNISLLLLSEWVSQTVVFLDVAKTKLLEQVHSVGH